MKKLLSLLAIALFTVPLSAQEVGLQLYSLRNQFKTDVPGTLKIINEWGITKIEGGGTYGLPMDEFRGLLEQNNLDVVSVGAGFEDLERPLQIDANSEKQGIVLDDDIILSLIEIEDTTQPADSIYAETALTVPLVSQSISEKVVAEPVTKTAVVIDTTRVVEQSRQMDSTRSPLPEIEKPVEVETQHQEGGLLVWWLLPLLIISSLGIIIWLILWRRRQKKEPNQ